MVLAIRWLATLETSVGLLLGVVISLGVWLSIDYWDWLRDGPDQAGNSAVVRNIALVIGAVVAFVIAGWRSSVAERQARVAERGLLNERYQKGAEMLGNTVLAVRLGGIQALRSLAEEHPWQYGVQVLRLLCTFVRHPPGKEAEPEGSAMHAPVDVQAALKTAVSYDRSRIVWTDDLLDFQGAYLQGVGLRNAELMGAKLAGATLAHARLSVADLSNANLIGADLSHADLAHAKLVGANLALTKLMHANLIGVNLKESFLLNAFLEEADLTQANLTHADLRDADLRDADLTKANLTGADLRGATVTQSQLDLAIGNDTTRLPDGLTIAFHRAG